MKPSQSKQLLLSAENYLQKIVAPQASQIDRNVEILKQVLLGMGELSLLGISSLGWAMPTLNYYADYLKQI